MQLGGLSRAPSTRALVPRQRAAPAPARPPAPQLLGAGGAAPGLRRARPAQPPRAESGSAGAQTAVATSSQEEPAVPPGCARYSISIKKPLGLVLEQNKDSGVITVVEISPESNADKTGLVSVGDQLIACSGVTYSKEEDYNGALVKKGQQVVRVNALGQSFKTVSAAIGSHPGHMEVKLEFQRCQQ